jgi:glutamyl-tRNA reductase
MTRLVAAGLSYRDAPIEVREAAALSPEQARTVLRYLVGHAGFSGAAVLSTCNRTDFYVTCADDDAADVVDRLAPFVGATAGASVARYMSPLTGGDGLHHIFRVAAGLESMVVGEEQVLGQMKDAHSLARDAGTLDARLDFVMRRAISVGKRVRSQTDISRGASNLGEVAVACARDVMGTLRNRGALLVGAGAMAMLAGHKLKSSGATLLVASRGASRDRLAAEMEGEPVAVSQIVDVAERVDVLVCSTASRETVLDAELVRGMQQRRHGKPLCIVDIAMPRDVDPDARHIAGVTLIDIDELGRRLALRRQQRLAAIDAAEDIVAVELRHAMAVIGQRDAAGPTISALNRRAEAVRRREVERAVARAPQLDADTRERIDMLTSSLVRKLLHGPITHLRESADDPSVALTIRQAFDLDEQETDTGAVARTRAATRQVD